jgi:hypothetical protein
MLKKIATEELRKIKGNLIEEFELSPDSIDKETFEGGLSSILRYEFCNTPDLSAVVGCNPIQSYQPFPCRKVVKAVFESGIRPLFVVSDSITLFDSCNIFLFVEDENQVSSDYFNLLEEIKNKSRIRMTKHTSSNPGQFIPTRETASHFNAGKISGSNNMTGGEMLLRKEINRLNNTKTGSS